MCKCSKCGEEMEAKGQLDEQSQVSVVQCPKCKNIELLERHFNNWFRLDYP
jgi:NAD-dependent SIR2 family protein deacetylase